MAFNILLNFTCSCKRSLDCSSANMPKISFLVFSLLPKLGARFLNTSGDTLFPDTTTSTWRTSKNICNFAIRKTKFCQQHNFIFLLQIDVFFLAHFKTCGNVFCKDQRNVMCFKIFRIRTGSVNRCEKMQK